MELFNILTRRLSLVRIVHHYQPIWQTRGRIVRYLTFLKIMIFLYFASLELQRSIFRTWDQPGMQENPHRNDVLPSVIQLTVKVAILLYGLGVLPVPHIIRQRRTLKKVLQGVGKLLLVVVIWWLESQHGAKGIHTDPDNLDVIITAYKITPLPNSGSVSRSPIWFSLNDIALVPDANVTRLGQDLDKIDQVVRARGQNVASDFIADYVKSIMATLQGEIARLDPKLAGILLQSGSSFENVRVLLSYEFDFMLEIASFVESDTFILKENEELGMSVITRSDKWLHVGQAVDPLQIQRLQESYPLMEDRFAMDANWVMVNHQHIVNALYEAVSVAICEMYLPIGWTVCQQFPSSNSTQQNLFKHNSGIQIILNFGDIAVSIDFIPCIRIPSNAKHILPSIANEKVEKQLETWLSMWSDSKSIHTNDYKDYIRLVPKRPHWKISTSIIEYIIFTYLPEANKKSLRIIKFLVSDHVETEDILCTYIVKTTFLKIWMHKKALGESTDAVAIVPTLTVAIFKLLELLHYYYGQSFVPSGYSIAVSHFLFQTSAPVQIPDGAIYSTYSSFRDDNFIWPSSKV